MKSMSRLPRPQPRQATARPSSVRQETGLEPGWGTAEQGTLGNAGVLDMLRANGAMGGVGPSSGGIQLKSVTPDRTDPAEAEADRVAADVVQGLLDRHDLQQPVLPDRSRFLPGHHRRIDLLALDDSQGIRVLGLGTGHSRGGIQNEIPFVTLGLLELR